MNKTYRTVWNATTGTWAAAEETARSRGKSSSHVKSAIASAVAMMAGVGGGAMPVDALAQAAANGAGGLNLCGATGGVNGMSYGSGASTGTALTAACTANSSRLSLNHPMAFQLYNNSTTTGSGTGLPSAATEVGIGGSKDGHLMLVGGSGVHIAGATDFANTVSMTNNRIQNLAAGTAATDAVNVAQLNAAVTAADDPYVSFLTGTYAPATAAEATGSSSTAIGPNAKATSTSAVALGGSANAGYNAVALGTISNAGYEGTAIGVSANAQSNNSVALGRAANATGTGAIAVGHSANATAARTVALGYGSVADRAGTVSVGSASGQRAIVNVAAGTQATDAVNLSQLTPVVTALGGGATINATTGAVTGPTYNLANGGAQTTVGGALNALDGNITTINNRLDYVKTNAGVYAPATAAVAGDGGTALGANASATGISSVAMGGGAAATAQNAVALGTIASATGTETLAAGVGANAAASYSSALGRGAAATAVGATALGAYSTADRANTVSVGNATTQRQITNLAAGTQATDAVNLSQLTGVTTALGGGAAVGADGSITQPVYSVGGNDYHTVSDALDAIAQTSGADAVNYDDASRDTVTLAGTNGTTITNVKAGDLSATSTDAVNGSQLFATNTRVGSLEDSLKNGGVIDPTTGESLAVVYDGAAKDKVTLGGGANGTTIANVKAGVADLDAVNVSQLKGAGLIDPATGQPIAAVTYDRNADGTPNYGSVTLGNGNGPTQIKNVADGTDRGDAVNLGQLQDAGLVAPVDPTNPGNLASLAVTYGKNADGTANFDRVALAGANGTTITNVKAGALSATSTDAVNGSQLFATNQAVGDLSDSLKNGGVIDPTTGESLAVVYDSAAKNHVTLGGAGASGPVTVSNVAAGVAATDAVNVQQLQQTVANGNPYIGGRGTGVAAQATGINAVALGLGSLANEINTISVGNSTTGLQRRITNVRNGEADSDAATVGQVNELLGVASTSTQAALDNIDTKATSAIQDVNSRLDAIGTTAGTDPYVQVDGAGDGSDNASVRPGTYGVAIGAEANATGNTAIAIGAQSVSSGNSSVALGAGASATGAGAVAFGSGRATGGNALALGNGTNAAGNNAVAAGFNAGAAGLNALAFGNTARANATDSMAFGTTAQVDPLATNGIAIGRAANVTSAAQNAVALGSNSVADRLNAISVGSTGQQRQIIYVSRGTADTDAVNVSQLKDAVSAFGGNAAVGADGAIVNPTYTVGGTAYHNVGDALNALAQQGGGGSDPLAVTYAKNPDGSANFELVSLAGVDGTTLTNLKAGALSATSTDAVNGSQLFATNQAVGDLSDSLKNGGVIDPTTGESLAVVYDDATKTGVTLGNAGTPVAIHNVAEGALSATSTDAVNGSQLFATNTRVGSLEDSLKDGGVIDPTTGESLAVVYDGTAKDKVTLGGGANGTTITNVKAGVADLDAVNVSQLKGAGLIDPATGQPIAAVTYDRNADGTPNYGSVTLGNGNGPTQVKNVANATDDGDALNLGQLKQAGLVGEDGQGNLTSLAVAYDDASKGTVTLGGGANGTTITNVKAGELSATSTDAVNGSQLFATNQDIGDLRDSLKDGGVIDPTTGESLAVVYDSAAKNQVTLGGANASAPVQLKNVAAGTADTDAVNVAQLKDTGLVAPVDPTNPGAGLTSLAVTYGTNADGSANFDQVALKGANGTTLSNVKAGVADLDAVNVSQLKDSGLIDPTTGQPIAAVTYDRNADGTPNYGAVTLGNGNGPTQIKNVANATEDGDALNLGQLKQSGLVGEDGQGNLTSLAVTYDDATKAGVTLGNAGTPVALHNVAEGALSATSTDAVNGSQLFATNTRVGSLEDSLKNGGVIDPATGESLAVVYDSAAKNQVTLGGANAPAPVRLANVAAGTQQTDAVNVGQLTGVTTALGGGAAVGADGSVTQPTYTVGGTDYHNVSDALGALAQSGDANAVTYDDASRSTVTLGNGTGPVKVTNVADATGDSDALNLGQLKQAGLVGEDGQGNLTSLAVAYDDASKGTVTLGGGANGTTITNVKAGALSATSTDAVNGSQLFATNQDIGNLRDSLKDGGVIDPTTGESLAVVYDGTAKDKVTLGGGANGTTITNVKAGVADLDAVNVSQLKGAGLIDPATGQPIAAVTYDRNTDGTPNYGSVTLGNGNGPTQIKNVANATDDGDALNLGQLKQAGLVGEDGQGNLTSLAVTYDDATKAGVTLGNAGTPVAIHNVAEGALSATSTDAVNGSQLFATNQAVGDLSDSLKNGGVIDPTTGESLAVVYDSAAKNQVTLGGANASTPVQLKNVAAGTADTDAVNVAQLKDAGLVAPIDPTNPGTGLTSLAVTYGANADGSANFDQIALKGTNGTTITNVAAGAVNPTSTDAINGAQLYGASKSVADSLGGGATVGADGTVTNPTYSLADPADASQKAEYHNVGDALANLDGRVVDNTTNITVIKNQLADSGLVDPVTGQSIAAVTYDRNADGTPNYGSVTLGNGNGPVRVSNVADGIERNDAVNVGQLKDAGLVAPVDPENPGALASLAVTYGKNTDGTANFDQVVLAGKSGTTISNVKAGAVSATSTDAINGAQLHGVAQSVADSLGGGSTVDPDGKVTSPTYVVNNQTFNNVGDAITNISNSLTDGSIGLVQQDATTRDITVAKDTDGTVVDFTGTAGDRVLTGVAAGAVNATSKDAINGSQLYGTAQSVADTIGGGTTVGADGKLADTAIEVNGNKYKTVAEAVQAAAQYGATDSLAVRYDLNRDGSPNYGSVTLGGTGAAPVTLTNVADGKSQYDAVNFGQLSELSDRLDGVGDRVGALEQNPGNGGGGGGGSGDNPYFSGTDVTPGSSTAANAGTGTGNTAAGSGASVGSGANNATVIGSGANASKDNGTAIGSGAKSTGEGSTAIGQGSNAIGSGSVAIGQGSVANEANTVSFGNGTDDGNRRIVNIADGINANDATTKGQLDRAVGGLQGQINDVSKNAYSGIAAATALTMIPGVDPGKTLSFGVGGATYKGYQAVAFGGEARITQNLKMKAGVGLSSGGNTVGVGASYQW
ncbi:YadA-like family protein [Burkholderia cenocepacia]|uniref:YadA-like family protein n=1 Tax=Burkholderia cenocepacia TaxID=95486 RepID=UPI0024096646|nr:YadA-like family protein [Burkholderia cenocepacia]